MLLTLIGSGCSYRSAYEGMQASNRFDCTKQPPSQYDECMESANKSYDQYERERKQTLEQKDTTEK
ncbi:MAG: hypothetical protein AB8B80_11790 [Marinicellaceae bacterium]